MTSAPSLFNAIKIGSTTLPNRIFMSALTRDRAPNTVPSDLIKDYYVQRKDAGLIVTEGTLISPQGTEWPNAPGIWNKDQVAGWKKITDAVHEAGGHIFTQLWHVGRVAHPDAPVQKAGGEPVWGPSAVGARGGKFRHIPGVPGYITPTAIPDPWAIVKQYREAALNAKEAGFDGVELHGANGYLVHQFLDSTSNHRTDEWGGSVENRARFGLEILKALVEIWGSNVGLKVSPAGGYNDVGMPLEETLETFRYFITEADKLNIGYITLARYLEVLDVEFDGKKRATIHDVVDSYSSYIKNAKVVVNGGLTPAEAESLISSGKADVASFGFLFLTHPDIVKRTFHDKPFDNAPDFMTLYGNQGQPESDWNKGYTDYPALESYA